MATEFPEGKHSEEPDAHDPLNVDHGAVPLLPPQERADGPEAGTGHPESSQPGPTHYGAPAPGLEFAPPAPGLADSAVELTAPGIEHGVATPSAPIAQGSSDQLPPWALGAAPAAPLEASEAERAAWPTVDPMPLEVVPDAGAEEPLTPAQPSEDVPDDMPAPHTGETPLSVDPPPTVAQPAANPVAEMPPFALPEEPARHEVEQPDVDHYSSEEEASAHEMYDVPLGTLVYRSGLLSEEQIESALTQSEKIGKRLGEVLVDSEMLDERDLGRLLAGQKGLPFIDLAQTQIEPAATELLPAASARIYCALPIALENGTPVVAVSDPTNGLVVEGVRRAIGGELSFTVATRSELQLSIERHYGDDAGTPRPEPAKPEETSHEIAAPLESPIEPAPNVEELVIHEPAPSSPAAIETSEDVAPIDHMEEGATMNPTNFSQAAPNVGADAPLAPPTPLTTPAPTKMPDGDIGPGGDTIRVKVRLSDGDHVDAGTFGDMDAAAHHGRLLIKSMSDGDSGQWPFLDGRFVRPAMVVSIDLVQERPRY